MTDARMSDKELADINAVGLHSCIEVDSYLQAAAVREYGVNPRMGTSENILPCLVPLQPIDGFSDYRTVAAVNGSVKDTTFFGIHSSFSLEAFGRPR